MRSKEMKGLFIFLNASLEKARFMVSGLLPALGPYPQYPTKVFRKWNLIKDEILETNEICRPERTITL